MPRRLAAGQRHRLRNRRRNGLCVRYRPAGEVLTNNLCNIEHLSLSVTTNNASPVFPSENAPWNYSHLNIQQDCDAVARYVYVCYTRRIPPFPEPKLELLTRYAPLVWLASGEIFNPSSVDWAFPYLERFQNTSDLNRYWLRTKQALSSPSDWTLPVFAGNLASAPVYAYYVEKQPNAGVIDLVYFFYYPYNRGKRIDLIATVFGNHVGDWEHVTLRLTNGQPEKVYVAVHDFGYSYAWDSVPKTGTTHPIVYSASGSHGSWLNPGNHVYGSVAGTDLVDNCSEGTPWQTWERVAGFDYNAKLGLGTNEWPAWMNTSYTDPGIPPASVPGNGPIYRWGNPQDGAVTVPFVGTYWRLDNGPTGPADKDVWRPNVFQ